MQKRVNAIAVMIAAAFVLAVPSGASAYWAKHTTIITTHEDIAFEGMFFFTFNSGAIECTDLSIDVTLEPGTTGWVTGFAPTSLSNCHSLGIFKGCTVNSFSPTNLPWRIHSREEKTEKTTEGEEKDITFHDFIEIPATTLDVTFSGVFCPYHQLRLEGSLKFPPDTPHHLTSTYLEGIASVFNGTTGAFIASAPTAGSFSITPSGTFGSTHTQ